MARGELTRHFRTSSKATTLLDLPEPGRPVVEHVREDHADHPWPIRECGGVKQGIYSRALPIFLWTYAELNVALVDELMLVRGRHINVAVPDWTTIRRMTGREPSLTAQDLRSLLTLRGGKCRVTNRAAGKSAAVVKHLIQRLHAADRCTNHKYPLSGSLPSPTSLPFMDIHTDQQYSSYPIEAPGKSPCVNGTLNFPSMVSSPDRFHHFSYQPLEVVPYRGR
jgi:hypothetical protein